MTRRTAATLFVVVALVLDWLSDWLHVDPIHPDGIPWSELSSYAIGVWLLFLVLPEPERRQ